MLVKTPLMRALFVQSHTEMGGAENALLQLTSNLNRDAIQASVALLGFGSGPLGIRLRQAGVDVIEVPTARFRNAIATAGTIFRLARIIRDGRFHIVVASGGHPLLFARPAAMLAAVPCVWWVHGCAPDDALQGRLINWVEHFLGADEFVTNSEYTARMVSRVFPTGRVRVVHYGINLTMHQFQQRDREAARRELRVKDNEVLVGIFGRLQPWKGQHIFLQAAATLQRKGMACRFLIVGGSLFGLDVEYSKDLQQMSAQLGLNGAVLFLGHRDDTNKLMSACDIVVHASIVPEPWGLVVAEAMAAGRAVVAMAAGGPMEMICSGENGILSPPGDAKKLAQAIGTLVEDGELRRQLGAAARRYAEAHFDGTIAAANMARELGKTLGFQGGK